MVVLEYVALIIISYFIGNISWARIISHAKKEDITKKGSGNPGSMNMLRTYGAKVGFITLILDTIKGLIPSLIGYFLFKYTGLNSDIGLFVAGVSAIIGHMYPVIYKFKGGKGVACALGVFMVANPLWLIIAFVIGFVYVWLFDYGSVASLFIVAFMSAMQGYHYCKIYASDHSTLLIVNLLVFAIFFLIWFAHRKNIVRLLLGRENKANLQKSFKMKLSKQKREELKTEYNEQKSQLKHEYKQLRAEYKRDVRQRRKDMRKQYHSLKVSLQKPNADLMTSELENGSPKYEQTKLIKDE